TIIADPNSFGRVQSGHAGRIEAPQGGLAFVGKRVEKGDLVAYLQHHIEAYNRGNLQAEIAELEARIAVQESKLALFRKHLQVIPASRSWRPKVSCARCVRSAMNCCRHSPSARRFARPSVVSFQVATLSPVKSLMPAKWSSRSSIPRDFGSKPSLMTRVSWRV